MITNVRALRYAATFARLTAAMFKICKALQVGLEVVDLVYRKTLSLLAWLIIVGFPSNLQNVRQIGNALKLGEHVDRWFTSTLQQPSLSFGERRSIPFQTIHQAISFQASTHHKCEAVTHLGCSLSYRQLDELSDRVVSRLRALGVSRGHRVCLLCQRSIEFVISVIAILKSGASYIPLDGGIVKDATLRSIMEDAKPAVVLCLEMFIARVQDFEVPVLVVPPFCGDGWFGYQHTNTNEKPFQESSPHDEAYVIYTSGTTGTPKGVSVAHRNVINLICTSPGNLGIRPGTRVAQLLNISFDMGAWEILGCLANGGTLVLRGSSRTEWQTALSSVDVAICTPSILARFNPSDLRNIKTIATAGEPCTQNLADLWAVDRTFYNCCGPTEVTIVNTMHQHFPGEKLFVGKPTPNNFVYVLNKDFRPVPIGCPGLLWAGGAGVCSGYVNRMELTNQLFKADPYSEESGLMYNTGDRGILHACGSIELLGRVDDQVKIKGFRVDLNGVSAIMATSPAVMSATAMIIGGELWGFYSPKIVSVDEVRTRTNTMLPYYAVPTRFIGLSSLPMTSNGKVDQDALRKVASDATPDDRTVQ